MEISVTLSAADRTTTGKGAARRLRNTGMTPAVLYDRQAQSRMLAVVSKELKNVLLSETGAHTLLKLKIDAEEKVVMLKDHQVDPVKRTLLHADFYEVDLTRAVHTEVPLVLVGKPAGLEKGGLLQQIRRELTISAMATDLPSQIVVDVTHLDLGDSLHVEDVQPPTGVEIVFDVNFTLATVAVPKGAKAEEELELEGGEAGAGDEA